MERAIDTVLERLSGSSPHSKLRNFIPVLAKSGFYHHILNPGPDSYRFYISALEYIGGHSDPSSFGLGLGALAMAATCGQVLKAANRTEELSRLVRGDGIFAFAISEKGWQGRIQKTRTTLVPDPSGFQILEGIKNFVTNGREADTFIIVANHSSGFPVTILLPRNIQGLEILGFDLPGCIEANHAELAFHRICVLGDWILNWDYHKYRNPLTNWERFSLNFLILGIVQRILRERPNLASVDYLQMEKDVFEIRSRLSKTLDRVFQEGLESIQLRDTVWFSGLFRSYFRSPDWETLYRGLGVLRRIFDSG